MLNQTSFLVLNKTCTISIKDIPDFLRDSQLFQNLESDDDFEISNQYFKNNLDINSIDDFFHLLDTLRYWGIDKIPFEIYDYIINNKIILKSKFIILKEIFFDYIPFVNEFEILLSLNDQDIILKSAENGLLNLIKYYDDNIEKNHSHILDIQISDIIVKKGHLECLKYIFENNYKLSIEISDLAAENGHFECLKYLHQNSFVCNKKTTFLTIKNGHLECLIYLHQHNCHKNDDNYVYDKFCDVASKNGHLECLKYLVENHFPYDNMTTLRAGQYGHFECLIYIHQKGCFLHEDICYYASLNGHYKCLKYCHENGCSLILESYFEAVKKGHYECFKYLIENRCYLDRESCLKICNLAAENGHLQCLIYCHENEFFWDHSTCSIASKNGHLECLRYLHQHDCLWDINTPLYAIQNGKFECFKYAIENDCPRNIYKCYHSALQYAKRTKQYECLKYICENNGYEFYEFNAFNDICQIHKSNDYLKYY